MDAVVVRHRSRREVPVVYCICETALSPASRPYAPAGWTLVSHTRASADPNGRYSGGVAMLFPPGVEPTVLTIPVHDGVELDDLLFCSVKYAGAQAMVGLMYLVPGHGVNSEEFLSRTGAVEAMLSSVQDGLVPGVPPTTPVYLAGDFNCRVGGDHLSFDGWCSVDSEVDSRGRYVVNWLSRMCLRIANDINGERTAQFTNFMPGKNPTTVDFFVAEAHRLDIVQSVITLDLPSLDPNDPLHQILMQHNHRALVATLTLPAVDVVECSNDPVHSRRRLVGPRVLDDVSDEARRAYVLCVNESVRQLWHTNGPDGISARDITVAIDNAASQCLRTTTRLGGEDARARLLERQRAVRVSVRKLHKAIRRTADGDLGPRHPLRAEQYRLQRELRAEERRHEARRVRAWQKRVSSLNIARPRVGYALLREPLGTTERRDPIGALYTADRRLVVDRISVRNRLQQVYAEESAAPDPDDARFSGTEFECMRRRFHEITRNTAQFDNEELSRRLSVEEIVEACRRLNTGRASDYSGMRSELLRWFTQYSDGPVEQQPFMLAWTQLLNDILFEAVPVPEEWRMQIVCPVFKRGTATRASNPLEAGNYRPIVVCSRLLACLDVAINKRLMDYCLAHELISDMQYGFIRGRGCEQAIAAATFVRELRAMTGRCADARRTYCALIDMRRAFDTTWRERLWVRLHEKGIRGVVWRYLQRSNLVDYIRTVLIPGLPMDQWYTDGLGCAQGTVLSPLMFDLEFNDVLDVIQQVRVPGAGIDLGNGRVVYGQLFADDGLLFASTEQGLQAMVDAFAEYCRSSRRQMNASKCEIIVFRDSDDAATTGVSIVIDGIIVPEKQVVRYLGAYLGARDVMPGVPAARSIPRSGWLPKHSEWFAFAWPKLCAAAAQVRAAADLPEYSIATLLRFWLSFALPHTEYGASSLVRGTIDQCEKLQVNVIKRFFELFPNDSVAGCAVLMEAGIWRMRTRHHMCSLRLLSEILRSHPSSQIRAIFDVYVGVCERMGWPTGSWCAWVREALVPLGRDSLLHGRGDTFSPRSLARELELVYWRAQLSPPPVGLSSLSPHYSGLKIAFGREDYLHHPSRLIAASVGQARIGYGPWYASRGARDGVPREERACVLCNSCAVETVSHCLTECAAYNDLRDKLLSTLQERLSPGFVETLGAPQDNPVLWTHVLLQSYPAELGMEYCLSYRALSRRVSTGMPSSVLQAAPAERLAAEIQHILCAAALEDRRTLFSVGQRFVHRVVRSRLAIERSDSRQRVIRRQPRRYRGRPAAGRVIALA